MTPDQIDALLDRIRDERGEAIDPARITDLLAADDDEATAAGVLDLMETELEDARATLAAAESARDEALIAYSAARGRVSRLRYQLSVIRTADGYITHRQASAAEVAARTAQTLAGRMPDPATVVSRSAGGTYPDAPQG